MTFIWKYFVNFVKYSFAAIILTAIAGAFSEVLGGFFMAASFFGVWFIAWHATTEEADKDNKSSASDLSGIRITVTSTYDDDDSWDDYHYHDEKYEVIQPSQKIKISDHEIENCILYVNNKKSRSNLCHLIPKKLKADKNGARNEIGYWPSYSHISPGRRYDYLKWLSEGKDDPDIDIGLVFLYFYGLEWRIVKENTDYEWVAKEVLKLMSIYDNGSFQNYAQGLLAFIALKSKNKLSEATLSKIKLIAESARPYSTMSESGVLIHINNTSKVTPEVLFSQIPNLENVSRSKVPNKVGHLFYDHLKYLLRNELAELCSKAQVTDKTFYFYTASDSIGNQRLKGKVIKIPKKSQKILATTWNSAIEDLRKYSSRIDKDSKEKLYTLLPENLKKDMDHPLQEKLVRLLADSADQIVKFGAIAEMCGFPFKDKYTLKECCTVSDILKDTSVSIEPEPNYFRKSFKHDDLVCIYKDNSPSLEGPTYSTMSMLADLGISLAYADGEYDDSESRTIEQFISDRFGLSNPELSLRMSKRLKLYTFTPPKTTGLVKKLSERLKVKDLNVIGNFLFEVAIADGVFDSSEQKYLKKVFKGLGIDNFYEASYSKYSKYVGNTSLKPSSIKASKKDAIPQQKIAPALTIDKSRLLELESETKQVQSALAEIFIEDEAVNNIEKITQTEITENILLTSDEKAFLSEVLKSSNIKRDDMRGLAKKFGFMPGPVIERINEWCEAEHGDFLIFDEGDYIIETDVIQQNAKSA